MSDRREFLKTGALALGGLLLTKETDAFFSNKAKLAIGLQLYTLSGIIEENVQGSLKKVADIGYKEIESAASRKGTFYGLKPKEFGKVVKDLGMSWIAHHAIGFHKEPVAPGPTDVNGKPVTAAPVLNLRDNMQELVDQAAEGGVTYLVCSRAPMGTFNEVNSSIELLNRTAEACRKAKIRFAYHNHDSEFKIVEGKVPYDMLLSQTNPENLKLELDLCWVIKAGFDPVELFKKNPGRFHLWHAKDIDKDLKGPQPVGTGIVDFERIFANAGIAGMQHFFVEHDKPEDPYASITTSFKNLQKIINERK